MTRGSRRDASGACRWLIPALLGVGFGVAARCFQQWARCALRGAYSVCLTTKIILDAGREVNAINSRRGLWTNKRLRFIAPKQQAVRHRGAETYPTWRVA